MTGSSLVRQSWRIAVSGYYGCGNAGDEAVLAGIRDSFAGEAGDRVQLTVLSQNPAETTRLHGIPAIDRMSLTEIRRTLRSTDLLLSGGGSLLQDTTSMRSLLYYLWVARMAYTHTVPVMFYAQGLGPLRRPLSRTLVRMVANRAAYITVRDEPSARLLASLKIRRPPIEVTADPAFALRPADDAAVDAVCIAEGLPRGADIVGVSLRPWGGNGESPIESYAGLLEELAKQCGMQIALLPMQVPGDVAFAEAVVARTAHPDRFPIIHNAHPPDLLLGVVGRMKAVVAMRLHTLIFGARMGVPPFALSYDPKVENLMHMLGLADSLEHWRGFEPVEVAERVAAMLRDHSARVAALEAQRAGLEARALRNVQCALGVLEHKLGTLPPNDASFRT